MINVTAGEVTSVLELANMPIGIASDMPQIFPHNRDFWKNFSLLRFFLLLLLSHARLPAMLPTGTVINRRSPKFQICTVVILIINTPVVHTMFPAISPE